MAPFRFFSNKKNQPAENYPTAIYSTARSYSVDEISAMQIPAVKASVELISSTISSLPVYLYEELRNGDINEIDDPRVSLLNETANKYDSATKIKKLLVKDLLLYGRAYLFKQSNEFHYLEASKITQRIFSSDGITVAQKVFTYNGQKTIELSGDQVIEFSTGTEGVLVDGSTILQKALNELNYSTNVMTNGALPLGVLKTASRLTENAINSLRNSWENIYGGPSKAGKTLILEEGMDYQAISMKPDELQLNESSKQTLSSIARLFNLPESLINSEANKYNSLEQNNLSFLQYTITPLITLIESTLNHNLLEIYEKNSGFYFRFDTSEVLRTTQEQLVDTTIKLFDKSLISANEARAKLDMKRLERDYYFLSLGSVIKDAETGELTILNQGQTIHQGGSTTNEDGTSTKPNTVNK
ncbi:phage portal protein [Priestia sp. P5]|uniref:phage portal protein n=1 Tax=Priestia sp. P5 TaxID=2917806 RepID=UPI002405CF29|nr:phage portal protein [Priestia sp. P5]MDG0062106.1 phage portal protein [Priestia sp. P5]